MEIKNITKNKYFTAVDGCKITELFGIPTFNLKEVSLAYAILSKKGKTIKYLHKFLEIYVIVKGNAIMHINNEKQKVIE